MPSACAPRDNGAKRSSEPARSHRRSNSPLSLLACRRWRVGAPAQPQSVAHSHERGSLLQCRTAWVCEGSRAAPNPNVACMLPPVRSLFLRRACTVPTAHGIPPASSPDNPTQIYKRPPCARGSFGTSIPMFLTCEERMKISLCHSGKKSGGRGSPDAPDIETSKDGDVSIAPHPPPPRQKRCAHAP